MAHCVGHVMSDLRDMVFRELHGLTSQSLVRAVGNGQIWKVICFSAPEGRYRCKSTSIDEATRLFDAAHLTRTQSTQELTRVLNKLRVMGYTVTRVSPDGSAPAYPLLWSVSDGEETLWGLEFNLLPEGWVATRVAS